MLLSHAAWAGNEDEILNGPEAVLAGGAVTAVVSDGSALHYNPAGLHHVDRDKLDVSCNAYVLRRSSIPAWLVTPAGPVGASSLEVTPVPSALTFARRLNRSVVAGAGIFVLQSSDVKVTASQGNPGGTDSRLTLMLAGKETQTRFVAGFSAAARKNLWFGVSVIGSLHATDSTLLMAIGKTGDFVQLAGINSAKEIGFRIGWGVQWHPTESLRVGVALESPLVQLARILEDRSTFSSSEGAFDTSASSSKSADFAVVAPFHARAGIGLVARKHLTLIVDGSVSPPFSTVAAPDASRRLHINGRAGVLWDFHPHLRAGAGIFTDRDPVRPAPGASPTDFYGASVGITWRTDHHLADPAGPPALSFMTTLGFRYAHGEGRLPAANLGGADVASRITTDEASLSVISGFAF